MLANVLAVFSIVASFVLLGACAFTLVVVLVMGFSYRDPKEEDDTPDDSVGA